ncbi:MAG: ion transporter [Lachnospiraceae bacterium]|nr:ion transporter [Lachnospiraceae bacterium]
MEQTRNREKSTGFLRKLRGIVYRMVSVDVVDEKMNQIYDVISTGALILNLIVTFANTYDNLSRRYGGVFRAVEAATVFLFAVDYLLRLFTAAYKYPKYSEGKAFCRYAFSFTGLVDLLSFLPYYLPFFFPAGTAVFRMFRVVRILRLFRINSHYDSMNVITEILISKKQQLLSSVFIIVILMMASSLCMYSVEHSAQSEVFKNAFSGIWWSASTLLTVGYGDIYPVTTIGKMLGIIISFLGVGMVAIPTGIISAGFVEQYGRLAKAGEMLREEDIRFVRMQMQSKDKWIGKSIAQLNLPQDLMIVLVMRGKETMIPRESLVLKGGDILVIGAQAARDAGKILNMKEVIITGEHSWNNEKIKDLEISRQTFIVMIKRGGKTILPDGDVVLMEHDKVYLYSKKQTHMGAEDYSF